MTISLNHKSITVHQSNLDLEKNLTRAVPTEVSHRHNTRPFDGRNNVDE